MPVVGLSSEGDGFAKLLLTTPNQDFELYVLTFDAGVGYPMVCIYATGRDISVGFLLDPFTQDGKELLGRWRDAGHIALALFQSAIPLDHLVFPFGPGVAALLGCAPPDNYDSTVCVPAIVLPALHREIQMKNLVLVAATGESTRAEATQSGR